MHHTVLVAHRVYFVEFAISCDLHKVGFIEKTQGVQKTRFILKTHPCSEQRSTHLLQAL